MKELVATPLGKYYRKGERSTQNVSTSYYYYHCLKGVKDDKSKEMESDESDLTELESAGE